MPDPRKIMGSPIAWWGTATVDCRASVATQTMFRNQNGDLAGVTLPVRRVRMVPYRAGLPGEFLSLLLALALARKASRLRPD